jgi:hypothetical protein
MFPVMKVNLEPAKNYAHQLEKNNVFLKACRSFDIDDKHIYFLDTHLCTIFKVEFESGKLVKVISSRGQGPSEIQYSRFIRVKNNKIFVLDSGFNGLKIFSTDGDLLKELKLDLVVGSSSIDVNDKDEIFIGRFDKNNKNLVSVFNLDGQPIKQLIHASKIDNVSSLKQIIFRLKLDEKGNIYILFNLLRKLAKYDANGTLLWESSIDNSLLRQFPNNDRVARIRGSKNISVRKSIFNLDLTPKNNIVVGHAGGGAMFSPSGKLVSVLHYNEPLNLSVFKIKNGNLINCLLFGEIIYISSFKE